MTVVFILKYQTKHNNWINKTFRVKRFGDFNGDGKTDITVGSDAANNHEQELTHMYQFINRRAGFTQFYNKNDIFSNGGYFRTDFLFGDFNSDGKTDIFNLIKSIGHNKLITHLSMGGSFKQCTKRLTTLNDWVLRKDSKILTGDFNGDGNLDIVVYNYRFQWKSTPIYFSVGNGDFNITNYRHLDKDWINDRILKKSLVILMAMEVLISRLKEGFNSTPSIFF